MEQIRRLRLDSSCGSIKKATLHANRIRPSFSSGTRECTCLSSFALRLELEVIESIRTFELEVNRDDGDFELENECSDSDFKKV